MIEVNGLTKYYGDRAAVVDVTFSVPRGQVLGFLGPNGAGKSTTMRILTGYLSASGGTASIGGFDVFEQSLEVRRRVGYLPELAPLYGEMRVDGYLTLMCRLRGVPPSRRAERIGYAIEACGLADRRHEIIGRLSKGLRQRVALAQAVVHDPEVLILDEPTAGLDPAQTRETRALIGELGRQHTVILSSHILPEVSATCERVVIINQGRLVADDTPRNLSRRLSQGRAQQVEAVIRGSAGDIEQRLRLLPGVEQVQMSEPDDGERQLVVTGHAGDLEDTVAKTVIGAGLGLRELRSRALSLEDVFLELTMEEAS
ncbi:MAG: ABC transporter ATP-binding protein [Candidatus Dormibacteraeota bacterium]|nr:ABC transporter ATP-binding protein [Candidatus Dormibacteraeota bacterium]